MKSKSYTLYKQNGQWLGQIVLTSDGMFSSVTDYGNFSYAWRSCGNDFRRFLCGLSIDYFSTKMYSSITYIAHDRKIEKACEQFASHILPALQKVLQEELEQSIDW